MTEHVKGYKATMPDGRPWYKPTMRPYVAGRTYRYVGHLELCRRGLHFCRAMCNVYHAYEETYQTRVFEVTVLGQCVGDREKQCTHRLRIDRELSPKEILDTLAVRIGDGSTAEDAFLAIVDSFLSPPCEPRDGDYSDCSDYSDVRGTKQLFEYLRDRRREFLKAARDLASANDQVRETLEAEEIYLEDVTDD